MARKRKILPFLLLSGLLLLTGCASGSTSGNPTGTAAGTTVEDTSADVSAVGSEETKPGGADISETDASETDTSGNNTTAPETEAPTDATSGLPETDPPATDPPATEPPATQPPETEPPTPAVKTRRVILLSGQSNAVGHSLERFLPDKAGKISDQRYQEMKKGYSNIKMIYSNNPFQSVAEGLRQPDSVSEFIPVTFGYGVKPASGTTFGPEVGLAEALNKTFPGEEFYIIKCATGGSNLRNQWNPANSGQAKNLYDEMLSFTDAALKKLTADGSRAEIVAFLWMQGEGDSGYIPGSEYIKIFDALIGGFEKKFDSYLPAKGMAVVQAGISSQWSGYTRMNDAKKEWAEKEDRRYYVDTLDLSRNLDIHDSGQADLSHYDAAAEIVLGNRFAECVIERLNKK